MNARDPDQRILLEIRRRLLNRLKEELIRIRLGIFPGSAKHDVTIHQGRIAADPASYHQLRLRTVAYNRERPLPARAFCSSQALLVGHSLRVYCTLGVEFANPCNESFRVGELPAYDDPSYLASRLLGLHFYHMQLEEALRRYACGEGPWHYAPRSWREAVRNYEWGQRGV